MPLLYIPNDRKTLVRSWLTLLGEQEIEQLQIYYQREDKGRTPNLFDVEIAGFLQALKDQLDDPTYD